MSDRPMVRLRAIPLRAEAPHGGPVYIEKRWLVEDMDGGHSVGAAIYTDLRQCQEAARYNGWDIGAIIDESSSPDWEYRMT